MGELTQRIIRRVTGENRATTVAGALKKQRISTHSVDGVTTHWAIFHPGDEIQSKQMRDGFYEIEELRELKRQIGTPGITLDIGANVGNHSVFFAQHMGAERVIPVEPFPPTVQQLLVNLALNHSPRFDLRLVGKALGDGTSKMRFVPPSPFNSGMAKLVADPNGDIETIIGDKAFAGERIGFIKVDVEGMEVAVLSGLRETMQRCKPSVFVEATTETEPRVRAMMTDLGYQETFAKSMYADNVNILFR